MLDDHLDAARVPPLKPVQEQGTALAFGGSLECTGEGVKRKLAETVRLSAKQRNDNGRWIARQSFYPLVDERVRYRAGVPFRSARAGTRVKRDLVGRRLVPPPPKFVRFH